MASTTDLDTASILQLLCQHITIKLHTSKAHLIKVRWSPEECRLLTAAEAKATVSREKFMIQQLIQVHTHIL